jgi:MFS family permease
MRPASLPMAFAAFGVVWGAWQAALFDLAAHYGLSSGPLGLMLTAGFVLSLPAMLGAGRVLDRLGAGATIAMTAAVMAVGLAAVGVLPPLAVLVAAVVVFASGSGAFDVAINGAAMGDEGWSRPARLTLLHAAFSGGGMLGALGAGGALGVGVPFALIYVALAALLLATALLGRAAGARPVAREGEVPRAVAAAMLPLAAVAALAFLAEGTMETWSSIYLRDDLGSAALVGALGPASFHAAMLAGRLVGAGVAGALGAARTLLVASAAIVAGMVAALAVTVPAVAIGGMAVAALGASFVVPVIVSLAAGRAGPHAGRAASYVLSVGYAGFLVGPSLVGLVGEAAGLRVALLVVPMAAAVIGLASRTRVARETG